MRSASILLVAVNRAVTTSISWNRVNDHEEGPAGARLDGDGMSLFKVMIKWQIDRLFNNTKTPYIEESLNFHYSGSTSIINFTNISSDEL